LDSGSDQASGYNLLAHGLLLVVQQSGIPDPGGYLKLN